MKIQFTFILLICFSINLNAQKYLKMIDDSLYTFQEIKDEAEKYFTEHGRQKHSGYKQYKRWEHFAKYRVNSEGKLISFKESYNTYRKFRQKQARVSSTSGNWQELGANQMHINTSSWSSHIGRISAIAIDPNNYNHLLVGSPGGGVWKSIDKGNSWTPIFEEMASLNVYSILISPHDPLVYYVGTKGLGILKSTDGGKTWIQPTNNTNTFKEVSEIIIHPNNANILYATAKYQGLYKSTDGGNNWYLTNVGHVNVFDVKFKIGTPSTIFLAGESVFKSIDNGDNWTEIKGFGNTDQAKMIALTQDDPNYVYIISANSNKTCEGVYLSTNGLNTINKIYPNAQENKDILANEPDGTGNSGQAPRDMAIAVSPTDKNEIHVGGIITFKSLDGGKTFNATSDWTLGNSIGFVHADIDILVYEGNTLYIGSDGGLFTTTDKANSFVDLSQNLNVSQYYKIGVSKKNSTILGGTQDNGTKMFKNNQWYNWLGADGMECFVDKNNPNIFYGTSQYGRIYKSTNGGNSYKTIKQLTDEGPWVTPLIQDPQDDGVIYSTRFDVFKTSDDGEKWEQISNFGWTQITELQIAESDNQTLYAHAMQKLYKTVDGGKNWVNVAPTQVSTFPYSPIFDISIHPTNPNRIAIIISNGIILESIDGGLNWVDISSSLPNIPFTELIYDYEGKNGLYAGTQAAGVYYKNEEMNQWIPFFNGLPNAQISELEINQQDQKIYLATYGRGIWVSDIYKGATNDYDAAVELLISNSDVCGSDLIKLKANLRNNGLKSIDNISIEIYLENNKIETLTYSQVLNSNENIELAITDISNVLTGLVSLKAKIIIAQDDNLKNNEDIEFINVKNGTPLKLSLEFDDNPSDISWTVKDNQDFILYSSAIYVDEWSHNRTNYKDFCLVDGCFNFTITDSKNNGLSAPNSYTIKDNNDKILVQMKDQNFSQENSPFCVEDNITKTVKQKQGNITIYPNPCRQQLTIELPTNYEKNTFISIYNTQGQLVYYKKTNQLANRIQTNSYTNGLYLVKVQHGENVISSNIIIQK